MTILTGSFVSICNFSGSKQFFSIRDNFHFLFEESSQIGINFRFAVYVHMILISVLCFPLPLMSIYTLGCFCRIMVGEVSI